MKPFDIPSPVMADVLATRPATLIRVFTLGPFSLMWDTGRPVPDREAGEL